MKSSFALKIAGYTLTAVSLIGCGREGASCDLGAKSKESGRTAGQITAVYAALDEFMASAPTNGLRHYFQDHRWTNHIVCVRRRLRKINADIDAVPSLQERIKVLGRYESRILGGIVVRPREFPHNAGFAVGNALESDAGRRPGVGPLGAPASCVQGCL